MRFQNNSSRFVVFSKLLLLFALTSVNIFNNSSDGISSSSRPLVVVAAVAAVILNKKLRYREEHSASDLRTNLKLMRLLIGDINLHSILHRFQVIADY